MELDVIVHLGFGLTFSLLVLSCCFVQKFDSILLQSFGGQLGPN